MDIRRGAANWCVYLPTLGECGPHIEYHAAALIAQGTNMTCPAKHHSRPSHRTLGSSAGLLGALLPSRLTSDRPCDLDRPIGTNTNTLPAPRAMRRVDRRPATPVELNGVHPAGVATGHAYDTVPRETARHLQTREANSRRVRQIRFQAFHRAFPGAIPAERAPCLINVKVGSARERMVRCMYPDHVFRTGRLAGSAAVATRLWTQEALVPRGRRTQRSGMPDDILPSLPCQKASAEEPASRDVHP